MKITFINTDMGGVSRSIRACYGKCGRTSVFSSTGHGITGVVEIYEESDCDDRR